MTTETLERRVIKATVSRTPTDGRGTFDFEVHPFEVDSDNERIKNFTNVAEGKRTQVPVDYQHTTEEIDPGGTIGQADVAVKGDSLEGTARLAISSNPMAMAVYERLLLPEDEPLRLAEVSIFYAFEPSKAFKGDSGELVQVDCELLGIAVVHKGAQRTSIMNVKNEKPAGTMTIDVVPRLVGWDTLPAGATATWTDTIRVTADDLGLGGKAGRTLSSTNESKLRQAADLLTEVLSSVRSMPDMGEPKAEETKAEEPETAKAEESPEPEGEPDARAQWDELTKLVRERG